MKDALERLFKPQLPTTIIATVSKRISTGRFEVEDDGGVFYQVDANKEWPTGSRVEVQSGRIMNSAGKQKSLKTFYV